MKLIERATGVAIVCTTLLFAQTASAYLQLTYQSNPLQFLQGYLGGEPYDDIGSNEPPYPTFDIVFDNIYETTSTQSLTTGLVSASEWPGLHENIPATSGSITLGADGTPIAWNFSLALTKSTPGIRDVEFDENGEIIHFGAYELPTKTSWLFESSYGANTCNCERYRYDDDLYIERAYYSWAYANTIGFLYGADSSPGNWSATTVDVPEPKTYLLLLLGMIVIGVRKMRLDKMI